MSLTKVKLTGLDPTVGGSSNAYTNAVVTANVLSLNSSITSNSVSSREYADGILSSNVSTINGYITTNTNNTLTVVGASFDKANTANSLAQLAYDKANTGGVTTLDIGSDSRLAITANTGNITIDLAPSGITAATYTYPSLQADAYGRITTISSQTPVTSLASNGQITLSQASGAISVGLANVNSNFSSYYGGEQSTPVILVDGYGRITSVSNSTTIYAHANAAFGSANTKLDLSTGGNVTGATSFEGSVTFQETTDVLQPLAVSSTTAYDTSLGSVFYHSSVAAGANWTANFTNVSTTDNRTFVATIIVSQGATGYIPSAVQIDGSAQTIKWVNSTAPTGTASKTEIFAFSLVRTGGSWVQVLGQSATYG